MTQLSNVNKVDPHTGFGWTLLKAGSSLHLGRATDVWLRVQSSHLSVFLMLTLCILVVCRPFKHLNYTECHNHAHLLNWSCELKHSLKTHTCVRGDWWLGSLIGHLTAPRPQSFYRHVKCSLFNRAALEWLSFDVLNYPPPYCLNICSRSAAITHNPVL